ncbi:MAG: serine hydrolase [Labilithrix sp.]|nr:serine hydrolase [Labilithrix sp.]
MKRHLRFSWQKTALSLCIVLAATLYGCSSVSRAAHVPTHFTTHQLCSAAFVAGLDSDQFYREAIAPKTAPIGKLIQHEVDRQRQEVRASILGVASSRAVYEPGYGCRVRHGSDASHDRDVVEPGPAAAPPLAPIAGPEVVLPSSADLRSALDDAFVEPTTKPHRWTKAVVIVHHGHVVGERYAPGVEPSTPLIGWSMTKSVTNALLGILVRQGKLDMYAPAPVPAWTSPTDPRHGITSDHLLRMVSGIQCGQSLHTNWKSMFDADTQMEFDRPDQAAFAASAPLRTAPGKEWQYTNCNFILLSRIIFDNAGRSALGTRQFMQRELFTPLGMEHPTMEFDSAGTPLGTIHLWATARDWARFGLLYLRDGVLVDGQRLLPEGWVDYSARLTPQSHEHGYGAGFWTQRGNSQAGMARIAAGMPADSFMALGSQGQYTIIIPSKDLVIVKLGWAQTPSDDFEAVSRLVKATIAALH